MTQMEAFHIMCKTMEKEALCVKQRRRQHFSNAEPMSKTG